MGAATSQLIAYRLALNKYTNDGKEKDLPAPISNINFSAPQTGDKDWYSSSMVCFHGCNHSKYSVIDIN